MKRCLIVAVPVTRRHLGTVLRDLASFGSEHSADSENRVWRAAKFWSHHTQDDGSPYAPSQAPREDGWALGCIFFAHSKTFKFTRDRREYRCCDRCSAGSVMVFRGVANAGYLCCAEVQICLEILRRLWNAGGFST